MHYFLVAFNIFIIINHIGMALAMWLRKNNTLPNIVLGIILILPAIPFISNTLSYTDTIYPVFPLLYISGVFGFLFGPAILLYFSLMMGKKIVFSAKHIIHFIPPVIVLFFSIPLFFYSETEKIEFINNVRQGNDLIGNCLSMAMLLHILTYIIISWRMYKMHMKEVKSFFSDMEKTKLRWVKMFILFLSVLNVLIILAYIFPLIFYPAGVYFADLLLAPLLGFSIYMFILMSAFLNQAIFTNEQYHKFTAALQPFNVYLNETINDGVKYGQSAIDQEVLNELKSKLDHLFEHNKPYLDPDLSLNKLGDMMNIPAYQASQLINREYGKTFFDLINDFRVQEAKNLLLDTSKNNLKIDAVGELSGFNSRATFYSIFKKMTGETPSQYKKKAFVVLAS